MGDGTRQHDQAPVRLTRESFERALDLDRTLHLGRNQAHLKRRGRPLDGTPHRDVWRLIEVQNNRHSAHLRCHLLEHLQELPAHRELTLREAGDVAARPVQVRDEPAINRIVDLREDDRNVAGRPLQGQQPQCTSGPDHVWL
jgi:hypothetical protein